MRVWSNTRRARPRLRPVAALAGASLLFACAIDTRKLDALTSAGGTDGTGIDISGTTTSGAAPAAGGGGASGTSDNAGASGSSEGSPSGAGGPEGPPGVGGPPGSGGPSGEGTGGPIPLLGGGNGSTSGGTGAADAGCTGADCVAPCTGESCGPSCAGCLIASDCVAASATNPSNVCQICDPTRSLSSWSDNDGAPCDDGLFCTVADLCAQGACAGAPRQCEDGVACNGVSTCDEANHLCTPGTSQCGANGLCDTKTGMCVSSCAGCQVAGSCVASGAEAPDNPCMVCDPTKSSSAYSPVSGKNCGSAPTTCSLQDTCSDTGVCLPNHSPGGTACGDATTNACDNADTCDGNGNCLKNLVANGTPCDDGLFCTIGDECQGGKCTPTGKRVCSEGSTCSETAAACQCTGCTIGGACVAANTLDTSDACQICDPTRSATGYSINSGGNCGPLPSACSGQGTCNAQGTCVAHNVAQGSPCGDAGACGERGVCDGAGACPATSVDLQSDPANCGACGHDCQDGACTKGVCQPFVLVGKRTAPKGLVAGGDGLYWIEGMNVNEFPKSPTAAASVTAAASNQSDVGGLRWASQQLYWGAGAQIFQASANGAKSSVRFPKRPANVVALSADAKNIYWLEAGGTFYSAPLGAGAATSIGNDAANPVLLGGAAGCVYFTHDSALGLFRLCPGPAVADAGAASLPEPVFHSTGAVRGFTVDADGKTLYVSAEGQGLYRLGSSNPVATGQAMGDIETNTGFIFYVDGTSQGTGCTAGGFVSRISKSGGSAQAIPSSGCIGQLAVDADAVYWADPTAGAIMKVIQP
jgi:hypothetical protein